jgi:hypothetical protein
MSSSATVAEPLLRTLAPALRRLEGNLRTWLDAAHHYRCSTEALATLESLASDLRRQADALDVDRPLLVIMLMGGTGVGKSTLLNALAGGTIAQVSFARPTTRDPVVYYHESVRPERLDLVLRHCRLAPHDRPNLEQKILVDTPDLDSNDLSNREKLFNLLPVADMLLYVGSQEKYHDKLGWQLFLQQRQRRAFAFVLNKWDRCVTPGNSGLRPDDDLLRDLRGEGFENPLLFRVCAQYWVDRLSERVGEWKSESGRARENENIEADQRSHFSTLLLSHSSTLPEGEQFQDLVHWLEMGLTQLEIEAVKARGVYQLLHQLQQALEPVCPPDLTIPAAQTRARWDGILAEEAAATAEVLLNTLEPYQREIEHHFTLEGQRRFRGLMAGYLHLFTRLKYIGSTLRDHMPFLPRPSEQVKTPTAWNLESFTRACSSVAADRHLDARGRALANRLLIEADQQGFPLDLLSEPTEAAAKLDWRQRHAQTLIEVLQHVELEWAKPTGFRRWLQNTVIFLADWVPPLVLLASCVLLLWQWTMQGRTFDWHDLLLPAVVLALVLVILHVFIALLLPLRWSAIRGEFQKQLERRLLGELQSAYNSIPADVAEALRQERQQVEQLLGETREIAAWLDQRQQAASIAGLYGK